ncbi:membrane protein [Tistrella bauzanensis]|uniref:Membrane protein n=1 Tax=Tistrella bauzanensis TaxID=657419 RepID=A0ABQ1IJC8_9PROT|nr:CopD family protein [Tistrella bauzanensis]GGB44381.1 membrane protein [Tistrella bauzanensis]
MLYAVVKAAHLLAVFALIAGMLANALVLRMATTMSLRRQAAPMLATMTAWDSRVTGPALGLTWLFGLSLAVMGGWFPDAWLMVKLVAVLGLSALHGMQAGSLRRLSRGRMAGDQMAGDQMGGDQPSLALPPPVRHAAAVTAVLVAVIVVLVIIRPF